MVVEIDGEGAGEDGRPALRRVKRVRDAREYEAYVGRKAPKKEMQPNKYDGKSSWEAFHKNFNACKVYNCWTDAEAALQLYTCCHGSAMDVLAASDVDLYELGYQELVRVMTREFGPRDEPDNCFSRLKSREQKVGESYYDLAKDIKRMTIQAMPNVDEASRDRVARSQFLDSLTDPSLRKELYDRDLGTLDEMLRQAERSAEFQKLERTRGRSGRNVHTRVVERNSVSPGDVQRQMQEGIERAVRTVEAKLVSPGDGGERVVGAQVKELKSMTQSLLDVLKPNQLQWASKVHGPSDRGPAAQSYGGQRASGSGVVSQGVYRSVPAPMSIPGASSVLCFKCRQPGHMARECTANVPQRCFKCGEAGHYARECGRVGIVCFRCGKEGHLSRTCTSQANGGMAGNERGPTQGSGERSTLPAGPRQE
jgi:hypothetical protein